MFKMLESKMMSFNYIDFSQKWLVCFFQKD